MKESLAGILDFDFNDLMHDKLCALNKEMRDDFSLGIGWGNIQENVSVLFTSQLYGLFLRLQFVRSIRAEFEGAFPLLLGLVCEPDRVVEAILQLLDPGHNWHLGGYEYHPRVDQLLRGVV